MSGNRLLIASALLVGLLGLTVWQWKARETEDARPAEVSVTLPKVQKDAIDGLEVAVPGKTAVKLAKQDKLWRVTEPVAAPADQSAVDTALGKLAELEVLGVAATKEDNHKALEVDDAQATHVVAKQGGKVVLDVLLGGYRSGNTMLRQKGSPLVATIKGSIKFAFEKEIKDWRDRTIVDVPLDKVTSAVFVNEHGSFRFITEGAEWKQAPGEKPIKGFDGAQVKSILGSATNLSAMDFAPAGVTADSAGVGGSPIGMVQFSVAGDKGPEEVILHIGRKLDSGYYVGREGKEPIYTASAFVGDRLLPSAEKFVKEATPPPSAAAPKPAGGMQELPPGLLEQLKGMKGMPAGHPMMAK